MIHALKGLELSTSRNFGALQLIQENTSILCRITECFKDETLVDIIKPLLEHPKITLITFDFTYDFDMLQMFDIELFVPEHCRFEV